MRSILRRLTLALPVAALLVALPGPAQAGTDTLRRSLQNLVFCPFDAVLSPLTAGRAIYRNFGDSEDTAAVKAVYLVPGYFWQTGVSLGASVLRGVAGSLELLPGLALLPFDAELDPLYDLAEQQEALVDYELPGFHVRFGLDYVTAGY